MVACRSADNSGPTDVADRQLIWGATWPGTKRITVAGLFDRENVLAGHCRASRCD